MSEEKIIIIGAGAAGLMAARTLREEKIPFLILEGSDRIGGRAHTLSQSSGHKELGPEFLHGKTPVTDALMEEYQLPWYDMTFDYHLYQHGKLECVPDFWNRICTVMKDIDVKEDLSFRDYIEKIDHHTPDDQKIAKAFVQGFDAADLSMISTKSLSEMKDQVCDPSVRKMRRPLNGYGPLMENLAELNYSRIRFAHRVEKIEWSENKVIVSGHAGEGKIPFSVEGAKIIVTSSIATLKHIEFSPMPEELTHFLEENEMGQVMKLVARLQPEFFHHFKDKTFPFIAAPELCFTAWWTTTPIHTNMITAWAGGEKARKLQGKSEDELKEVFVQELATLSGLCPARIHSWIKNIHYRDWGKDPHFMGAYSYPKVVKGKRHDMKTDFQDTLYLAGEAFHETFSGTIEGAFLTGKEAAEKAIQLSHLKQKPPYFEEFIRSA